MDFDITPDAAGAVSGIITLSYEDASGNPQTVSKDFFRQRRGDEHGRLL